MARVVTYQLAYRTDEQVDLCDYHVREYSYPLGAVQHGQHDGVCEACESEEAGQAHGS